MSGRVERGRFERSCDVCGWAGVYSTERMADKWAGLHSCEKRLASAARSERYRQKLAAVDRTPKPCVHKVARHEHGTRAAYVLDKCRCYPCRDAAVETERERYRQQAYGRYDKYVDAEPSRQHLRRLMDQGMGLKRIAATSDLSQGLIWKLLYGKRRADGTMRPTKRVHRTTQARVMAVKLDLADGALVDGTGARRRVQALVALGWSQSKIAELLQVDRSNFNFAREDHERVTVANDRAIRALYDELSMRLPPESSHRHKIAASRSRRYAKDRGWLPPLAWNDIDDPSETPSTGEPGRRTSGLIEDVEWLADAGESLTHVASRLKVRADSLQVMLARRGRSDLYWRLAGREPNAEHRRATVRGMQEKAS